MKDFRSFLAVLAASATLLLAICSVGAQETVPGMYSSAPIRNVVSLVLGAENVTVPVGQRLRLSIGIQNRSALPLTILVFAPWDATTLEIRRADGSPIKPNSPAAFGYRTLVTAHLAPGAILPLRWRSSTFNDIANWGYTKSLPPGTYTILAHPFRCCGGYVGKMGQFRIDPAAVSDRITVHVL